MKWQSWNKWPVLGVVVTAVVLAAPPGSVIPVDGIKNAEAKDDRRQLPHAQAGQQVMHIELERLRSVKPPVAETGEAGAANAFNPVSWYEPPPPPPPQPMQIIPEPEPVAPPLPFVFFGRYEDPPKRVVMLARNDELYTVSEGDVIDGTYRIEHITDGAVDLVYLPLGTNQTISMGAQ